MLSTKQLEILAVFFPELGEKTLKEIEVSAGLSHEPTFRILKSLVKNGYLEERKVGKTNVYKFILTDDAYLIYAYFMAKRINRFKEKYKLLYKRLKEFVDLLDARSVILFGSYAKGTETKKSDIDIIVVSDQNKAEKLALTFKTKYSIKIRPVVIKLSDFKNIKKDNEVFYKDLVKFGIVLDGLDFFFKEVYKHAKAV